ncbi:myosin light chain kinase, smooth muscle-like [Gouania willdenowi]|uniref:Myosin light chain kinase, smooth muscle-like n=1 Tax=Gouania willdenowi TaxID=441366 RepID=A0A8C5I8I3_GOUWI|nr:myosin light chain kinase, smooth muscle-like [Gouania willdenowi]XP_028332410.1 myosin light chain kinase, smooth muscle-like [Gouania willdenowi]
MDNDGRKSNTFVSTFRLALKPKSRPCCEEKQQNGVDTVGRTSMGDKKLGASFATDARCAEVHHLEAPHFKEPLRDCTVCVGGDATFQGVITGSQPLAISWQHNGEKLHSRKSVFKNQIASVTLTQCSSGDAGIYTCTAENPAGELSSSAVLHVKGGTKAFPKTNDDNELQTEVTSKAESRDQPELSSASKVRSQHVTEVNKGPPVELLDPPEQVEVQVGEKVQLHCEFRSSSVPVVCCWIFNRDKVVTGRPRTSVNSTKTYSEVKISQASPEDTGLYTIIVRNRTGSAQHTISLSVIDRPHPPASPPVVSKLSTQSLVLSWTGPSYDGGTAVLGYIVEVIQEGLDKAGSWTEIIGHCKNTSYHVRSGLEPLCQYRFRVKAYNSAGISDPSQESDSIKMATSNGKTEECESYVTVSLNTKNKVRDHYDVHEKLGFGKFGEVYRLTHKETGQECAGKFYRGRMSKEKTAAREEIELMNKLHHPKIVQCVAAYDTRPELVMVMEYIAGGELFERIVDDNFEHTEPTSARYMQQILEGMQYVHKQNIIHLDLKPENIVCVDTTGTRIKIIDFGLARELEEDKPLMVMHGTPEFVAPEVINYEPVGLETDMWSIGVICYILLSGESPFQGNNDAETFAFVTAARYEFDPESFEDISEQAKDFISSLLKKDMSGRLSCREALSHPWMVSFTPLSRRPTKSLNKMKMKRFLAKRKWKKTGKAVLALQRMANLSSRPNSPGSSSEEPGWSHEAEEALQALDKQLQIEPRFLQALKDAALPEGATAQLTCHVNGYPQPEVKWLQNEKPVYKSSRITMEQQEDGLCSLVLSDLKPADSGVYVCRATNELGEATCSAKLKVAL